jgi:Asp/Glu/hydantoin racemase
MKTVYAIHTGFALVEPLKPLFAELLPAVRLVTVVDDSLLADVRTAGQLTAAVTRRLTGYGILAAASGADAILNCCSSVGEAADLLARMVEIPVVKIDDRMARTAVETGSRIGVLATVPTTLDPTERLLRRKAAEAGSEVEVRRYLVDGAFDALMDGDAARHDALVLQAIERAAADNDVVALAQGSMARLVSRLPPGIHVPVLSSPRLGVEALRSALGME